MAVERKVLVGRRDFMQDPAASIAGGVWRQPLANVLDARPQVVAEAADNRDWNSTWFAGDLGYVRKVNLIWFAYLHTSSLGVMRVVAGVDPTFAVNTFDTGFVPTWPPEDAQPFTYNPWGEFALTHVYMADEYEALGYPRFFPPPDWIDCRFVHVQIRDGAAAEPLRIGCFGVSECWQPPRNFVWDWQVTSVDESDVSRVPLGSTYVDERGTRQRMNLGFGEIHDSEVWTKARGIPLVKGRREPLVVVPFPDLTTRIEKQSIYGRLSEDSPLSNPYFETYAMPFQIDQDI